MEISLPQEKKNIKIFDPIILREVCNSYHLAMCSYLHL